MASDRKKQFDSVTGTETTGHEWDGVQELNTPLPRWWLWLFYITIIWSIGYWIVYPAWPLFNSYTTGYLGWHSRSAVVEELAALTQQRAAMTERVAAASLQEILDEPKLLTFAKAQGRAAFAENCAPCHGSGGGGGKGYPNLIDDDWLWGGKLDDIALTIRHGIRSTDTKGRQGAMPAFGRDKMLERPDILAAADYVLSLAKLNLPANADLAKGRKVFADNCVACHGEAGKGNREIGAPDLTDPIWMYGASKDVIIEGLVNGRGAVMPPWGQRLDDTTIKALAVYVHQLGGGEK